MRLLASGRRRQAASLEEEVIGVLVVSVGLTLADLILRDRPDLNRLQGLSLEFDVGDDTLPNDRLVQQDVCRRRLKDEIPQIIEDRPAAIDLDTVQQRRAITMISAPASTSACVHFFSHSGGLSRSGNSSSMIVRKGLSKT